MADAAEDVKESGLSTEELAAALQAQIRSLEQRELSQMRQGAILQRKLDAAEQNRRELEERREERLVKSSLRRAEEEKAQSSAYARRQKEAVAALEKELQQRLEDVHAKEKATEESLRAAQAHKGDLEEEVDYWRRVGQELLRRGGPAEPEASDSGDPPSQKRQEAVELELETKVLKARAEELREQIKELERMAASARSQEAELVARNRALAERMNSAEAAAAASREKAALYVREEKQLQEETAVILASLETRVRAELRPEEVEEGRGQDELDYWRRRIEEKTCEVNALEQESARLRRALQCHAGSAGGVAKVEVAEVLSTRGCGPLDEMIAWFAMSLFKSALMRRAFCIHLALLYSWIVFLLWWISGKTHH